MVRAEPTASNGRFPSAAEHPPATKRSWWLPALVGAVAIGVAGIEFARFLPQSRSLWYGALHDRHAHYVDALNLALDLGAGRLRNVWHDINGMNVWPPVHPLLTAAVLLVTGPDHRAAVLPSLAAWAGTVLLAFLVARRASFRGGNLAGLAAALFVLTSFPHRAFAINIMFESLGACLTLAALYGYLCSVQDETSRAYRFFGAALTALFFTKVNYWLLVVAGIAVAELAARWPALLAPTVALAANAPWRTWLARELRQPLNYVIVALLVVSGAILATGGTTFVIGQRTISIRHVDNFITIAYALFLLRIVIGWRRGGGSLIWPRLPPAMQSLVKWHVLPVAIWWLMPKRLSSMVWYLTRDPASAGFDSVTGRLAGYWGFLTHDYLGGALLVAVVLGLIASAVLARWFQRGGVALAWFVLVSAVFCVAHQNCKSRFLHSWIAVAWVLAGVGLASIVHARWFRRLPAARIVGAVAAWSVLAAALLPNLGQAARAPEGEPKPGSVVSLELTDAFLPELSEPVQAAVLATLPMRFLCRWTVLERFPHPESLETEIKNLGSTPAQNRQAFDRWLAKTPAQTIVLIEVSQRSCFYSPEPEGEALERIPEMLAEQKVFSLVRRTELSDCDCSVTIWHRVPEAERTLARKNDASIQ